MALIKICGLKRKEDVEYVNEFRPDYVGFVFAGTKRRLTYEQAKELRGYLRDDIPVVGVFVNEKIEFISKLINDRIIDCVQLHGDEDKDYIAELKNVMDKTIIKAARVKTARDVESIRNIGADYLLLDAYSEKEYGGSGQCFDQALIPDDLDNYFLAGGLNADNIADLIQKYKPYAVDVSSGVETDGFKDREKIKRIVEIVRNND